MSDFILFAGVSWELETTAHNLRLKREARNERNEGLKWATEIEIVMLDQSHKLRGKLD